MQRDDVDFHTLSMSPPISANTSATNLYTSLQQVATGTAFGMLSPSQLLAANRQAAVALMATQLFPQHKAMFGTVWGNNPQLNPGPQSPPASPNSSITSATPSNSGKHSLNISPATSIHNEQLAKKPRKLVVKKDLISAPIEISMNVNDLYNSTGSISPPSSGSSPSSAHDAHIRTDIAIPISSIKDSPRDKSFTCKICSRSFGYKHVLQNHERTHTGEKPFECPECHKRFTRDHHLKTHMRLHTGEKPYHCSHCDRQFVQVANLRRHLRVHTGERPYSCEICDGKFSDSNQLKSHMLVHNGEKPFECTECHVKFRRRHHLLNHKCGQTTISSLQSPPTSPNVRHSPSCRSGEYGLCDQKSVMGTSCGSEESENVVHRVNISTSSYDHQNTQLRSNMSPVGNSLSIPETSADDEYEEETPLDLSESDISVDIGRNSTMLAQDLHRAFILPSQVMRIHNEIPEQTEPEDLSMHRNKTHLVSLSKKSPAYPSETIMDGDLGLEEFNNASIFYMRHQHHFSGLKHCALIE